jgi:hypothetical protein
MKIRRDIIFAVLTTFCICALMFAVIPIRSGLPPYDPWADINEDGKIDSKDLAYIARMSGTHGTPVNKKELLLELQAQIASLNASLMELRNQTRNIYEAEIKAYCLFGNHDLIVDVAKNGIPSGYNTASKFILIGDNTFTVPFNGPYNHNFTHWNTGSTNTTITVSSLGVYTAYYESSPTGDWFNGLIGYWKLDEGTGTTAFDSSGNGYNGTLENNPTWIDGKYGTAINFDGIDDYVAIPDLYSTSPTELSVSAWINSSLITTWWRGDTIIHLLRNGEFGLQLVSSGVICFGVKVASGVGAWDVRWNPSPNEWHQIVGTWKKGDSLKLYVDGTLVNQTAANDELLYDAFWLDSAIGSLYRSEAFFNGTIDEVMVYNRSLSADEVMAHYLLPPP